jgi:hypothetical protein
MIDSLEEMKRLLNDIAGHLKVGRKSELRKAIVKLSRIAALATTLALTLQIQNCK